MSCSRPPSTMSSICLVAIAPISSTTWMRPASPAICRCFVYPKGAPEKAAYIGHRLEKFQREVKPMWTPETQTNTWGSVDAMQKAVDHIRKIGLKPKRIATEFGFLPYDASQVLRAAFPDAEWVDALFVLERQRVKKSAERTSVAEIRLGGGDRVHAGGDCRQQARHHQGRGG